MVILTPSCTRSCAGDLDRSECRDLRASPRRAVLGVRRIWGGVAHLHAPLATAECVRVGPIFTIVIFQICCDLLFPGCFWVAFG